MTFHLSCIFIYANSISGVTLEIPRALISHFKLYNRADQPAARVVNFAIARLRKKTRSISKVSRSYYAKRLLIKKILKFILERASRYVTWTFISRWRKSTLSFTLSFADPLISIVSWLFTAKLMLRFTRVLLRSQNSSSRNFGSFEQTCNYLAIMNDWRAD